MNFNIKSPVMSLDAYEVKSSKSKTVNVAARPFCSLSYRKTGSAKFQIGENIYTSSANCITFIPKNLNYSTDIIEDTHIVVVHFNLLDDNNFPEPFVIENCNPQAEQLFGLVLKCYSPKGLVNYECYSHFYRILADVEKHLIKKNTESVNPAVLKAKSIIESNYSNVDFNVDALVGILNICASHLRSEFKKSYSLTPIEYLKRTRIQNAISLLATSPFSIEKIAEKCGYGSASYFIQAFRKATGYSPHKYKEFFLTD